MLQFFPMDFRGLALYYGNMTQSNENDVFWMQKALQLAIKAGSRGEVPVGALIVCDNRLLTTGRNRREELKTPLGHAELIALHRASQKREAWRLTDCTLYVTLEPCLMCAGALWQSRIGRVVFGAHDPKGGALGSLYQLHSDQRLNHRYEVISGILAHECAQVLKDFFRARREK